MKKPSWLHLCGSGRKKKINKRIKEWKKSEQKQINLLLLGTGESGKSTITKQMKILYVQGFDDEERKEKINIIRQNLVDSIQTILRAMTEISPALQLENPGNITRAERILAIDSIEILNQGFYDDMQKLWADAGVQAAFRRRHEYQLIDSAQYFLENINEVRQDHYVPTDQDILRSRVMTTSITSIKFNVVAPWKDGGGRATFCVYDVGGQRGERRKWIQVFAGLKFIIFVVDCSSFNQTLREDESKNRLRDAINLFADLWRNRFLQLTSFIIFYNKQDLLRQKLQDGEKLEDYFPEYSKFISDNVCQDSTLMARNFIKSKFLDVLKRSPYCNRKRKVFYHYTTAVDTDNIKHIFNDCKAKIVNEVIEDTTGIRLP